MAQTTNLNTDEGSDDLSIDVSQYIELDQYEKSILEEVFVKYMITKEDQDQIDIEMWRHAMKKLNVRLTPDMIDKAFKEAKYMAPVSSSGMINVNHWTKFCSKQSYLTESKKAILVTIRRISSKRDDLLVIGYLRLLFETNYSNMHLPPVEILTLIQQWYHVEIFNWYDWERYSLQQEMELIRANLKQATPKKENAIDNYVIERNTQKALEKAFDVYLDPDGNEDVDFEEWSLGLRKLNVELSDSDCRRIFIWMDVDKYGYIEKSHFVAFCTTNYESEELLNSLQKAILKALKSCD